MDYPLITAQRLLPFGGLYGKGRQVKVLFFSPSANIWEHSFPEALVGEMLAADGMDVTMARCRGSLRPLCPAGQAAGFTVDTPSETVERLCEQCHAKSQLLDQKLGLKQVEIDDFITEGDHQSIDDLINKANGLRSEMKKAEDFDGLAIEGYPVGRTALYELILRHKKNDFEFSDPVWNEFLAFLRLAACSTLLSKRLIQTEKPDRVSVYNSLYVAHRAFCQVAKSLDIKQYFMHAGTNLSRQHGTLMIGKDFTWKYLRDLVESFDDYKKIPISASSVNDVVAHFECLFSSSNMFVYSAARSTEFLNVRAHFGVSPQQTFIVASTSSYDERFAVEAVGAANPSRALAFPRILDWVSHLIELAKNRSDWFVLVRVHPREFPNRRDSIRSEHALRMKELLTDLPPNVRVNWPDDNISLYDIAQEADVFLNAWSSVGKEMALLGLPVVIYSPDILLYPDDINLVGTDKDGYLAAINTAIQNGWSLETSRKSFRWFALEFSRSIIDLRSSFAPARRYRRSVPERALLKLLRQVVNFPQENWDLLWRKPMPDAQKEVSSLFEQGLENSMQAKDQDTYVGLEQEEEEAIRQGLGRLGRYLFAANPPSRPSKLQRRFLEAGLTTKR